MRSFAILAQQRNDGIIAPFADQMAGYGLDIADRGYVLEHGRVVAIGAADALKGHETPTSAYHGGKRTLR